MDPVVLMKCTGELGQSLARGLALLGGLGALRSSVLIKPNICTIADTSGYACTHVEVVAALLRLLFRQDRRLAVRIVESDSENKYAAEAFRKYGYTRLAAEMQGAGCDVSLVDLSQAPLATIPFRGRYFTDPELPAILAAPHYVISIAVAKTHGLTAITGTLKNLFGLLPGKHKAAYHARINDIIVDLNRLLPPDLCLVDARVGLEGWNGPQTRRLDTLILGRQPVSVDATMARLMALAPERIRHVVEASHYAELGTLQPPLRGQSLAAAQVPFAPCGDLLAVSGQP